MDNKHSIIGPSKSHQWMHCPGSVNASQGCPNKSGDAAALGTAAHLLGELTINKGVRTPNDWKRPGTVDGKGQEFTVDEDMCKAVGVYTSYVRDRVEPDAIVMTETPFSLPHIHPDLFGTNDCLIAIPNQSLHVIDYKHGRGCVVEICDLEMPEPNDEESVLMNPPIETVNTQLLIYALGAIYQLPYLFAVVKLTIVQPRAEHDAGPIRSVILSVKDVIKWGHETLKPAAERCFVDNPEFQIGSWCKWCPVIACPAVIERSKELACVTHDPIEETKPIMFPTVESLTPVQLGNIHAFASQFASWADDIKAYIKEQLKLGKMTSQAVGFKLVAGNKSREFANNYQEVIQERAKGFIEPKDFYHEPKEKSVAQIEATLKDKGVAKKARDQILADVIVETPGAPKLVPVTAPGQELPSDASSVFEEFI